MGIGKRIASNAAENISTKTAKKRAGAKKVIKEQVETNEGIIGDTFLGTKKMREAYSDAVKTAKNDFVKNPKIDEKTRKSLNFSINRAAVTGYAKDYLMANDFAGRGMARGAALTARHGMIAGAVLAPRILSGGSLTENNRGERDIAGIPFV